MDLIFPESMKAEKFADTLFTDIPVSDDTKMCVVIPARNEEQYIWACLDAFVHQTDLNGQPLNRALFEVLVLVNNSTDCSAEIVRDFQRRNTNLQLFMAEVTLPKPNANIGFIRKALKTVAYHRLRKQGDGLILTTDADTKVARDWLAQNQNEIDNGAEVVGGRILLRKDEFQSLDTGTQALYFLDEQYQFLQAELEAEIMGESHDPAPRHHQHFNGSFAITTDC
ncbi:MAG TPA: glycosyl transferase, partial [Chryseobacterium sp.]|nr:glycosyl transferase [Chryseobacterium sp.]